MLCINLIKKFALKNATQLFYSAKMFYCRLLSNDLCFRQVGEDEKGGKLEEILQCKDLTSYLPKNLTENGNSMEYVEKASLQETVAAAKCPPDILCRFRPKTPKKIAINLIKQQYNIR